MTSITASPLFGVGITVIMYTLSLAAARRFPRLHPLVPTCGLLIALLLVAGIPYDHYRIGGDILAFGLGPATIALGVPLYRQRNTIRRYTRPILLGILAGSVTGIASAWILTHIAGGSAEVIRSMLPKSVTTPISMELSRQLRGAPELTAVLTVLAGLLGSIVGPRLLRWAGVRNPIAIGLAVGTAAHGIGTARLLRDSQLQGGVSGLAMALAGIVTALLVAAILLAGL